MSRIKKTVLPGTAVLCLIILIIDARTAFIGAQEGVQLCIQSVVPSLFPFFIISGLISKYCSTLRSPVLNPIMKLCGLPGETTSLLIIGSLGGYPVGAKSISDAYVHGEISLYQARRMLGFCNNAGPSFVFGMIAGYFSGQIYGLYIFLILVTSSIIAGSVIPKIQYGDAKSNPKALPKTNTLETSIKAIVSVCSWVILFRIIITFLKNWFLWMLPDICQFIVIGLLELSNGCLSLGNISNDGLRFIIGTAMLSFGGLCVYMQIVAVTEHTGTGWYLPGKLLQCLFSISISIIIQYILFDASQRISILYIFIPIALLLPILLGIKYNEKKKTVAFSDIIMYNTRKTYTEEKYALS